jgi:hypothetical protein
MISGVLGFWDREGMVFVDKATRSFISLGKLVRNKKAHSQPPGTPWVDRGSIVIQFCQD